MAKLFGNDIEPACVYCLHGRTSSDGVMILCRRHGPVVPHYKCRKFKYNPLKRVPRRLPKLPSFSKEDFDIN